MNGHRQVGREWYLRKVQNHNQNGEKQQNPVSVNEKPGQKNNQPIGLLEILAILRISLFILDSTESIVNSGSIK